MEILDKEFILLMINKLQSELSGKTKKHVSFYIIIKIEND